MRALSIVGARPQFVKLAVVCAALARRRGWVHRIVHTGQHYDRGLSQVFFDELMIPRPDYDLGVGSGPHGEQTGEMLKRLEPIVRAENPDWVLLYGDTNSTMAGALAASKLALPTAHIEAGLRSFRRGMPEEINRIVADHLSDLLLCPTAAAVENLKSEGLGARAVLTGDVMYDASIRFRNVAENRGGFLADEWKPRRFALATVHRAENTDDPERLRSIVGALNRIAETICPVVWPVHPRTAKRLREAGCRAGAVATVDPISYFDMLLLEGRARLILTDSGGVQKEAHFFKTPCITLRDETEWTETLANNCNVLAGADPERIFDAAASAAQVGPWACVYGGGDAGDIIANALAKGCVAAQNPARRSSGAPVA